MGPAPRTFLKKNNINRLITEQSSVPVKTVHCEPALERQIFCVTLLWSVNTTMKSQLMIKVDVIAKIRLIFLLKSRSDLSGLTLPIKIVADIFITLVDIHVCIHNVHDIGC